jgi:hypothetical protein
MKNLHNHCPHHIPIPNKKSSINNIDYWDFQVRLFYRSDGCGGLGDESRGDYGVLRLER